ncbi:N-acetylmuramoyl-L-alanine amidase [Andreesenia angusta]|uniref:N-acetylmuramoyl-L-alanine amidase n=1 Tax=Andreesenia angusta TaxID=39480 RepID=A0A1S1V3T5_9FIRM|nr:N-acetylmuramoyl-L-alanine amidase [Andreesenia angusta]OHW61366.1 N-acetylmuramoyl-L-alanine amidase [Andreesenia angusta]
MEVVVYNPKLNCFKQGDIVSWARANKLDLVVENHRNSAGETSYGYESLVDHYQAIPQSIVEVHRAMVALGWRDRGFVKRNGPEQKGHQNSRLMRIAKIPYVLLEHGFISNPQENQRYDSKLISIGSSIYDAAKRSGVKRLGVIYGHGQGDPGACKLPRTEAEDVRRISVAKKKEEIDMTKEELNKILDERDRAITTKVLKEVTSILSPGEVKGEHWVNPDFEELNRYLEANGVPAIMSRAHNNMCTRAEVIRINNLTRKAIESSQK